MSEAKRSDVRLGVLFVCTGNICRSPSAEGVFRHMLRERNLFDAVRVDSVGTHAYHVGEPPDKRSIRAAARRGYDLTDLCARKLVAEDFFEFDYLLAMDRGHLDVLERAAPGEHVEKVRLFLDFSQRFFGQEVPDPYYGGGQGFEFVLDQIEDAARGLLDEVVKRLNGGRGNVMDQGE